MDNKQLVEKRKKQLNIEGEKKAQLEKRKQGLVDQQLVKQRLAKRTEQPKPPVDDIFKGKGDVEVVEEKPKAKRKTSRRKPPVELEGEEV